MNFAELISALEAFFNEIVGFLVPGGLLLLGLSQLGVLALVGAPLPAELDTGHIILLVFLAYLLGHVLAQLKLVVFGRWKHAFENEPAYELFSSWVDEQSAGLVDKGGLTPMRGYTLRGVAMTLSREGQYLSRRFRFIELLCTGSAMALILLALTSFGIVISQWQRGESMDALLLLQGAVEFLIAGLLVFRARRFYRQSVNVSFQCVVADLMKPKMKTKPESGGQPDPADDDSPASE